MRIARGLIIRTMRYMQERMSRQGRREEASNVISAMFKLRQSPYLECTSTVWAVCYTHGKLAVLCVCIQTAHTVEVHSKFGHRLINLAERCSTGVC